MKGTKAINNESGFIKFILVMLVIACMVYIGVKVGIPYYKYSALKSDAKEIARIGVSQPASRSLTLTYERASELKIPIKEEDIDVRKTETSVIIQTSWSETVDFLGLYQHTFHFKLDIQE